VESQDGTLLDSASDAGSHPVSSSIIDLHRFAHQPHPVKGRSGRSCFAKTPKIPETVGGPSSNCPPQAIQSVQHHPQAFGHPWQPQKIIGSASELASTRSSLGIVARSIEAAGRTAKRRRPHTA